MAKPKLTTAGYFIKRLRDSGYVADKLMSDYSLADSRSWTVIVDRGGTSVFITCFNNKSFYGEEFFEMYDGDQNIPGHFRIKTSSIEVIIEYLVKFNINNKSPSYTDR